MHLRLKGAKQALYCLEACYFDGCLQDKSAVAEFYFSGSLRQKVQQKKQSEMSGVTHPDELLSLLAGNSNTSAIESLASLEGCFTLWKSNLEQGSWFFYRSVLSGPPVFYYQKEDQLIIGTDLVQMRRLLPDLGIEQRWFSHFFAAQTPDTGQTPFAQIQSLPAGCAMQVNNDDVLVVDGRPKISVVSHESEQQWIDAWRTSTQDAVARSVSGHNKVAIMLSSGLDSGALAALLSQSKPDALEQFQAFCWRFPNHAQADESVYIEEITQYLKLPVHYIDIAETQCFVDVDTWPVALQAPYFNAMRRMKHDLYQTVTERGFSVLLNGHYGDNLYYSDRYELAELWQEKQWGNFVSQLQSIIGQKKHKAHLDPAVRYWVKQMLRMADRPQWIPDWLTDTAQDLLFSAKEVSSNNLMASGQDSDHRSHHRPDQYQQLLAPSQFDGLATEYEFTQSYGLQRVHPYLDMRLFSLALSCRAWLLNQPGKTKYIMRQALQGLLPETSLRRSRVGQLDSLFIDGLNKHQDSIRDYLFRNERCWPQFVEQDRVRQVLDKQQWQYAASIIVPCLGYERWLDEWRQTGLPV